MRFTFTKHCRCADKNLPRIASLRACTHCSGRVATDQLIKANGTYSYTWRCVVCNARSGPLPKTLWPDRPDTVRSNLGSHPECSVFGCKSRATELHHWAPRYLFPREADYWPTSYLCKEHHAEWHNKVTPSMMLNSSTTPSRTRPGGSPPGASTR